MRQQRVSHERPSCLRWHRFWGVRPQRVLCGSRAMLQMSPMPFGGFQQRFQGQNRHDFALEFRTVFWGRKPVRWCFMIRSN